MQTVNLPALPLSYEPDGVPIRNPLSMYERTQVAQLTAESTWTKRLTTSLNGLDYPCVYFLLSPILGAVKIGYTTNILSRLSQLEKAMRNHPGYHFDALDEEMDDGSIWHYAEETIRPDIILLGLAYSINALVLEQLLHSMYQPFKLRKNAIPTAASPSEWYESMSPYLTTYPQIEEYVANSLRTYGTHPQ